MKTNRSNSFRLHRLTKTNSLRKPSESFYNQDQSFKLDALHSVTKGVKYNDLSFITGRDLNKLRKQPTQGQNLIFQAAHTNLMEIRKKYDDMKKQRVLKEQTLFHLKEEKQKYLQVENQFSSNKDGGKKQVQQMLNSLQQKKLQFEAGQAEKKVLLSMKDRYKIDKVYYDQKKFDLQKQLSFLKKQLDIFKKQGTQIGQNSDRTTKIYEKLVQQLQAQTNERQHHLHNIQSMIEQKKGVLSSNEIRGIQIMEIAERAMLDKDGNQKSWQKIFLTHRLVAKLLKDKIQKQMEKFKTVQFAFKQIKTATGVNDAKTLIHKYLNKEVVYGQLLAKIATNQKYLSELKGETEMLLQKQKQLQAQKEVLQSTKVHSQDLQNPLKQLSIVQEKKKIAQLLQTKIGIWISRQFKKFNAIQKVNIQVVNPRTEKQIKLAFQLYFKQLLESIQKSNQNIIQDNQFNELDVKDTQKLTRIIPKKARKNSFGEEIYDIQQQQTNSGSMVQQIEIVNFQRDEVLRNNQKFMKQVKKRREQIKKLLIQKHKESQKKQKPKPAQEQKPQTD